MVDNRGNTAAYVAGAGHLPLPRRDDMSYRAAHQQHTAKPTSTFDWDWNKAPCTSCQTKVTKTSLIDGECPTCRGITAPAPPQARKRLEHSKGGDHVYQPLDDTALNTRFTPDAPLPHVDPETAEPAPAVEPPAHVATPEQQPGEVLVNVVALECQHATQVLTRAAATNDPLAGILRSNVLSTIAALDLYLELHTRPESPAATGPAVDGFQVFNKPTVRRRPPPPPRDDVDEQAIVREYVTDLDSAPTIAHRHGVRPKRIRAILERHHVQLRDDRATRSGSAPKHRDPATIDLVVRRYRDEQATIADLSTDTGIGRRQVTKLLRDAGVTIRPPVNLPRRELTDQERQAVLDHYATGVSLIIVGKAHGIRGEAVRDIVLAAGIPLHPRGGIHTAISDRLARLGVTSKQVKTWALEQGLVTEIARGNVPAQLVDAWEAAHPTDTQEAS